MNALNKTVIGMYIIVPCLLFLPVLVAAIRFKSLNKAFEKYNIH